MSLSEKDRAIIAATLPGNTSLTHFTDFRSSHEDLARLLSAVRQEAYKEGWNDREGDLIAGVNRIMPEEASQGAVEPVADPFAGQLAEAQADPEWLAKWHNPASPPNPQARIDALEGERDAWRATAEHHFAHMRAALDLSYHLRYPPCPMLLDQVADLIDCGDGCENAWREHDTNATGCTRSESAEGCPFEMACELRDFAKALRIQAWTLAFAPRAALAPSVQAVKGDDHGA